MIGMAFNPYMQFRTFLEQGSETLHFSVRFFQDDGFGLLEVNGPKFDLGIYFQWVEQQVDVLFPEIIVIPTK
jgi:hypothetical protein